MKLTYKPMGPRLLVDPIITTLTLEERAAKAGLEIVVEQDNRPLPTQGRVIALGSDPLLREEIKEGDIVFFERYSGHDVTLEGRTFRQLLHQEVTGILTPTTEASSSTPPTDQK